MHLNEKCYKLYIKLIKIPMDTMVNNIDATDEANDSFANFHEVYLFISQNISHKLEK